MYIYIYRCIHGDLLSSQQGTWRVQIVWHDSIKCAMTYDIPSCVTWLIRTCHNSWPIVIATGTVRHEWWVQKPLCMCVCGCKWHIVWRDSFKTSMTHDLLSSQQALCDMNTNSWASMYVCVCVHDILRDVTYSNMPWLMTHCHRNRRCTKWSHNSQASTATIFIHFVSVYEGVTSSVWVFMKE